jgi:hypothetical protein
VSGSEPFDGSGPLPLPLRVLSILAAAIVVVLAAFLVFHR